MDGIKPLLPPPAGGGVSACEAGRDGGGPFPQRIDLRRAQRPSTNGFTNTRIRHPPFVHSWFYSWTVLHNHNSPLNALSKILGIPLAEFILRGEAVSKGSGTMSTRTDAAERDYYSLISPSILKLRFNSGTASVTLAGNVSSPLMCPSSRAFLTACSISR